MDKHIVGGSVFHETQFLVHNTGPIIISIYTEKQKCHNPYSILKFSRASQGCTVVAAFIT